MRYFVKSQFYLSSTRDFCVTQGKAAAAAAAEDAILKASLFTFAAAERNRGSSSAQDCHFEALNCL